MLFSVFLRLLFHILLYFTQIFKFTPKSFAFVCYYVHLHRAKQISSKYVHCTCQLSVILIIHLSGQHKINGKKHCRSRFIWSVHDTCQLRWISHFSLLQQDKMRRRREYVERWARLNRAAAQRRVVVPLRTCSPDPHRAPPNSETREITQVGALMPTAYWNGFATGVWFWQIVLVMGTQITLTCSDRKWIKLLLFLSAFGAFSPVNYLLVHSVFEIKINSQNQCHWNASLE